MPAPGERETPDDHDDQVGFSSPASLRGARRPEPRPQADFDPPTGDAPDAELFAPRDPAVRPAAAAPGPASVQATPSQPHGRRGRRAPQDLPGGVGLLAVYALILFTVPTLGVAGLIALVAVWRREAADDPLVRSHAVYQKRTLLAAAAVAVAGIVLMAAPFALGVPVLFLTALWLVARGAWGVWTLKAGRPIADPMTWWIR